MSGGFDLGPVHVSELELVLVLRVALAAALVVPIGLEREVRARPAGLRTHILVGMGAALLTGIGEVLVRRYEDVSGVIADPTRIVHAIVIGIGFVGAGTIVLRRDEGAVRGLTTAANLLVVAAIGIAVGIGLYVVAVAVALLALLTVGALRVVERHIRERRGRGDSTADS